MSGSSKHEYLLAIYERYHRASPEQKRRILDEFTATCGYHRKYAIRLLNAPLKLRSTAKRPGRPARYHTPAVGAFLEQLLIASNLACSKRLAAMIPLWLPHAPMPIDEQTRQLLLHISPATSEGPVRRGVTRTWRRRRVPPHPGVTESPPVSS